MNRVPPDVDLFGEPVRDPVRLNFGAYPYKPGSGPSGETCRTCDNATLHTYHDKRYWKCGLVVPTSGPGTDIRLKTPACRAWRRKP